MLPWVSSASHLWGAYKWKGGIFTGERGVWGSCSLIFIPVPSSRGEEGFLSLFSLDQTCHGVGAWWVLICKANYYNESIMSNRLHSQSGVSRLSPLFFVCLQDTYQPKCVVSCQSGGSCFSLPMDAHGSQVAWFPATWPLPRFLCSYLPALTLRDKHNSYMLTHVIYSGIFPTHRHEGRDYFS